MITDTISHEWLGCTPSERFLKLSKYLPETLPNYYEQLIPYLIARGAENETNAKYFVQKDLFNLAHAFSLLFEQHPTTILLNLLGNHFSLIGDHSTQIDHIGRELFGPLSVYLPFLSFIAPSIGLTYKKNLIFASIQVIKTLQQYDANLKGVEIGRIYFQNLENGQMGCLELFQTSSPTEGAPQPIEATEKRLSLLTDLAVKPKADSSSCLNIPNMIANLDIVPIDHLGIKLNKVEEVEDIHNRILELSSDTFVPNEKKLSKNPADGSTQTKALMRNSPNAPFNKIIEVIHYS